MKGRAADEQRQVLRFGDREESGACEIAKVRARMGGGSVHSREDAAAANLVRAVRANSRV